MNAKLARIKAGFTMEQLRKKLKEEYATGISPCTLVAIERGQIDNVKFGTLKKIADALNSTVEELFL